MEKGPTSKTIHYDKVVSQLPTFVIENGPEEFNKFKDIILEKREKDPEYIDTHETAGHSVKAWLTKWDTHETDEIHHHDTRTRDRNRGRSHLWD